MPPHASSLNECCHKACGDAAGQGLECLCNPYPAAAPCAFRRSEAKAASERLAAAEQRAREQLSESKRQATAQLQHLHDEHEVKLRAAQATADQLQRNNAGLQSDKQALQQQLKAATAEVGACCSARKAAGSQHDILCHQPLAALPQGLLGAFLGTGAASAMSHYWPTLRRPASAYVLASGEGSSVCCSLDTLRHGWQGHRNLLVRKSPSKLSCSQEHCTQSCAVPEHGCHSAVLQDQHVDLG